ncbi:MAG: hypothetical protein Q7T55_09435 [Solirubrobacteraceae bacterium]|nr:hypothetical protein [Solirubrobacteraceae bacterium]
MRPGRVLSLALVSSVATFASNVAAATAITVGPAVALPSCPSSLAAGANGSVEALTRSQSGGRWQATVSSVDAAGAVAPMRTLSRRSQAQNAMRATVAPQGLTAAYETGQPKPESFEGLAWAARKKTAGRVVAAGRVAPKRREQVWVATLGPDGRTGTQRLSNPNRDAELHRILSRGGTTVVTFRESVPRKAWLQYWVAVRPAGASRFRPAVSLLSPLRATFVFDDVVLGDDGSGVVVSTSAQSKKPISARRIGRDGRLGPVLVVGKPSFDALAEAAVGADGAVTVAIADMTGEGRSRTHGLFISWLGPGAEAFSPRRLIDRGPQIEAREDHDFAITTEPSGRTTVVTGKDEVQEERGLQLYSGTGDQLVPARALFAPGALDVTLTPTVDAGLALTWRSYVGTPTDDLDDRYAQQVAFRSPDDTWPGPAPFTAPAPYDFDAGVRAVIALPGGGIAVARALPRPTSGRTRCVLERVTP